KKELLYKKEKHKIKLISLFIFGFWSIYVVCMTLIYVPTILNLIDSFNYSESIYKWVDYFFRHLESRDFYFSNFGFISLFLLLFVIPTITLTTLGCFLFSYLRFTDINKIKIQIYSLLTVFIFIDVFGLVVSVLFGYLLPLAFDSLPFSVNLTREVFLSLAMIVIFANSVIFTLRQKRNID
uniref:hypothetical protein n=1 Tax=Mycoplasmoides pneumoniae TaxID=2104 RepID=UPI001F3085C6